MEGRLKFKLLQLGEAVKNFEESLSLELSKYSEIAADSIKCGQVQKFEFCTELLWKTLKIYLFEINGIDANSPKMVMKEYFNIGLCSYDEYERIMEMLDDRNMLSHIYKKEQFEKIYTRVVNTLSIFKSVIDVLS
jgi:nucleotidyltransferase substrate binding protein (TIGR01987 family)